MRFNQIGIAFYFGPFTERAARLKYLIVMPEYGLCISILVLALAGLYMGRHKRKLAGGGTAGDVFFAFAVIQGACAILGIILGIDWSVVCAAPFILAYGPIGYGGLTESGKISGTIYRHFVPFAIFVLIYIYITSSGTLIDNYLPVYVLVMYGCGIISLSIYTFSIVGVADAHCGKQVVKKACFAQALAVLLLVACIFLDAFAGPVNYMGGIITYIAMLVMVMAAFAIRVDTMCAAGMAREELKLLNSEIDDNSELESGARNDVPVQKYNKSALTTPVLEDYKIRLDRFFDQDEVYLDNELTLESLANKLKMPMHHLTQLFNIFIGENFNQYVNKYRVAYACKLLDNHDEQLSMEEVAYRSGFNSKVSFNRHFKNITGMTPKEYLYRNI